MDVPGFREPKSSPAPEEQNKLSPGRKPWVAGKKTASPGGTAHKSGNLVTGRFGNLRMFGLFDIVVLILVRRRHCARCERTFWAAPPHAGSDISIGRESYPCQCGERYITGRYEWKHLTKNQKREYLWSGLLAVPLVITILAAIGGYFLRWHEPYWTMSVILGLLGLLSGLICSGFLLAMRSVPVLLSIRRTRRAEQRSMETSQKSDNLVIG